MMKVINSTAVLGCIAEVSLMLAGLLQLRLLQLSILLTYRHACPSQVQHALQQLVYVTIATTDELLVMKKMTLVI